MLSTYLKTAVRTIVRNRLSTFINIVGLAVGIAGCLAILMYVRDELSYDTFHKNADRIFRPRLAGRLNGHDINGAVSSPALGPAVYRDLPAVVTFTRLFRKGPSAVRYKEKIFVEDRFFWADSTIFDVFTLPLVAGNPKTALTQPNSVVVTESIARKYFDHDDPIGKVLKRGTHAEFVVTGVIKDVPHNSHCHPDFIASFSTLGESRDPNWIGIPENYTYLLLREGTRIVDFQQRLDAEVDRYVRPQVQEMFGMSPEHFSAAGNTFKFLLQPLVAIHLNSHLDYELEANSDYAYVSLFSAIAIAVLLIACTNFINLATARSERRAKEIGVRKTLGSTRSSLVCQFMAESMLMSLLAAVFAVGLVEILLPSINQIANKSLHLDVTGDPFAIPILACFGVTAGILAGSYPAFYLSSFRPIDVLRSGYRRTGRNSSVRSGLVIFQFAISIVLFVGTFIILAQLRYVQTKNLGFDKEEILVLERTTELSGQLQPFENELRANGSIASLTNSSAIPGNQSGSSTCWLEDAPESHHEAMQGMFCDQDFAETYKVAIASGRFFSRDHSSDSAAVVVNEEAEKLFHTNDLVGRYLVFPGNTGYKQRYEIIGVLRNFHYRSLHEPIRPLFILLFDHPGFIGEFVTLRLATGDHRNAISFIKNVWKKYMGEEEVTARFLDDGLQKLYASDQRTGEIVGAFSVLAIFIACLGLLGLAAHVTEQRTKEIGIRKTMGASVGGIVTLLSKECVKWVLAANLVAWPVAYFVMNIWLQSFAYRIDLSLWVFVASGALALVIALSTVISHALKAATANPVESLRYE